MSSPQHDPLSSLSEELRKRLLDAKKSVDELRKRLEEASRSMEELRKRLGLAQRGGR
ncbi:MAG: hypothetical protein ACXQT2_00195 [Methanotrichaceae archaeon]